MGGGFMEFVQLTKLKRFRRRDLRERMNIPRSAVAPLRSEPNL
jgi:hypothetical protein